MAWLRNVAQVTETTIISIISDKAEHAYRRNDALENGENLETQCRTALGARYAYRNCDCADGYAVARTAPSRTGRHVRVSESGAEADAQEEPAHFQEKLA
jgi:hypothetical protein